MNFEALKREKAELEKALGNLNNESDELDARSDKTFANMRTIAQESERVADVAHNARQILDDLDKEFERKTSLNGTDITFLFLATAIQCVRWYILSNDKFRITAKEGDKLFAHVVPKDWHDILLASVPYDATAKGESLLVQKWNTGLSGFTHRYRTLGHDPIMGWIFGPVNIITNSLTKSDFVTTYKVSNLKIDGPYEGGTFGALSDAWGIIQSDKMILPAAIARQALHFGTDYFTKQGLPLPFVSTASDEIAKDLMTKFHVDAWSVTRGATLAVLINSIVAYVHQLFRDPNEYGSPKLHEVKTKKIIHWSNVIASTSNVIYVAISGDLAKLDVGGILVTLYRLIKDRKFKHEVKREFITESFNDMIRGKPYDFD